MPLQVSETLTLASQQDLAHREEVAGPGRPRHVLNALARYGFAVCVTGLALLSRSTLAPQAHFATFCVAVALTAFVAGSGPTIVAAVLGYLCANWLAVEPPDALVRPTDLPRLIAYVVVSVVIVIGTTLTSRARNHAKTAHAKSELEMAERKRTEEALRDSEERMRAAFDASPDAINVNRLRDGIYVAVNDGFTRLSGWSGEEAIGKTTEQLNVWADREQLSQLMKQLLRGESIQNAEARFRRKDGSLLTASISGKMFTAGGEGFLLAITRDISDVKQAASALRDADKRKDDFLGMLSHELRNPLAPIRNALYILHRAEPGGQQARRAEEIVNRQLVHITRLVDDLLDVTRIAHGKITLRRAEVDLVELIRRTTEDHRALMQDRGLKLHVVVPPEPVVVNGDETRLAQVLGNLLHNASKFTPAGGQVTLIVERQGGRAVVHVRDTGAGMDAESLRTIFEPFSQGKQTLARTEGGLGLGLALVKGLVTMHGGDVSARSDGVGHGTEFVISLPLDRRHAVRVHPRVQDKPARTARRHVLVVEDNRDAAETLAEVVRMIGHEVNVALDGPSALEQAQAHPPDVVLCDTGLPGMDGYEIARQLRARGQRGLRLVAVSGYAQPEDVARATEAGFDVHMAKPPDLDEITRLLA